MNLAASWQQILPSMPVLPVLPTHNRCIVNKLAFDPHHGMEEVIGSIPIRSTNYFNHLEASPFRDFVASLSQIPKPRHEPAFSPAYRRVRNQPFSASALAPEYFVDSLREVLRASLVAFAVTNRSFRCPSARHESR